MKAYKTAVTVLGLWLLPVSAWPCAVCFGGKASPGFYRGFFIAAAVTLAVTFTLIGAIVAAIMRVEKRREAHL